MRSVHLKFYCCIYVIYSKVMYVGGRCIILANILPNIVIQMKQFVKTTKVPRLRKQIKEFLEKLNETSVEVTKKRSTVTFSPKDVEEIVSSRKHLFRFTISFTKFIMVKEIFLPNKTWHLRAKSVKKT